MGNGVTITKTDETQWRLAGIRDERARIKDRLNYLDRTEQELRGIKALGPKTATKAKPIRKRKRQLSAETRQKMRDAAQKRWGKSSSITTGTTPPPIETIAAE